MTLPLPEIMSGGLRQQSQADLWELEVRMVYIMGFRTAKAVLGDPASNKQITSVRVASIGAFKCQPFNSQLPLLS